MTETTGFEAYALYQSIKLHFTSDSYDFFRYNGKTNVSKDNFSRNKAKYSFYKLSRKYSIEELKSFYIANFLETNVNWVGDISGIEGEENYKKWQKRNQSLTYRFEQDIIGLLNATQSPNEMLVVTDGQYPLLLKEMTYGNISIETVCILNDIMNFLPMWDKKISDDVIWPTYKRKIEKYTPFIVYDKEKFKEILKESLREHA
jgi:hypothetical protein